VPASRKVHALIAAVAGGNTQAFEELYRLSCPKLYGLALRVLRQSDLVASAMRRAFIQIRADAHRHSPQEDPVGFLVARLRAATFDIARTGTGIDAWEPFEVDNPARDPLALGGRSLALTRLLTCLGALPEERRRMVLLAYYDGWSREALAIVFDAPVPAVRALIARSTDQIADCLGKKPPPAFSDVDRHMAAEYALGTLDAEERTAVRAQMEQAPEFGKLVRQWERRLAPLHELAAPVAPPPGLWTAIAGDLRRQPGAAIAPRVPVAAMPAGGASGAGASDAAALAVSPEGRAPGRAGTSARPAVTRKQGLFSFMLERVTGRPSSGAGRGGRGNRPAPLPLPIPVVAIPPTPPVADEAEFAAAEEPLPLLSPVPPPPRRSAAVQRHPVRSAVSPKAPSGPPLDAEARAAAFRALAEAIDLRIGAAEDASTGPAAPPAPEAPPAVDATASPAVDPAPAAPPDEAARAAAFRLLAETVDLRIGAAEDASTGQAAPPAPEASFAVDAAASPAADPVPAAQPDDAARAAAFRALAEAIDLRIGAAEDASTGPAAPPSPEAPPAMDAAASPAADPAPGARPDEAARAAAFRLLAETVDLRIGGDGEAAAGTSGAAAPDVHSSAPAPAPAVAGPAAPDDAARAAAFRALAEAIDLRIGSADGTPPAPAVLSGPAQAEEAEGDAAEAAARLVAPEGAAAMRPAEAADPVAGDDPPASAGTATIAEIGAEGGPEGGGTPSEPRAAAGAPDAVTGGPSQAICGDSATRDPPGATAASLPVPCDPPQGTSDAVSVVAGSQVAGVANAPASAGAVGAAAEAAVDPAREPDGASPSGAEVASLAAEAPQPRDGPQAASALLPAAEDGQPDEARPASEGAAPLHDASAPAADPVPAPDGPAINLSDAPTPHEAAADQPCAAGDGAAIVQAAEGSEPAAAAPASGDPAPDAPGQDGSPPARHPGMMDAVPGAEDADLPSGGAAGTSASIDHLPPTSATAGEGASPPQPVPAASALHGQAEPQARSGELGPADPQAEAAPAQSDETDAALAEPGAAPAERADVPPAAAATAASPAAESAAAATVPPTGVAQAAPAAMDGEGPLASAVRGDADETASAMPAPAEMSADVASASPPATGAGAAPAPPDAMPGAPPPAASSPAASSPADAVQSPADAASANGPEASPDPAAAGPQPIVLPPPVFKSAGPGAPAAPAPPGPEAEVTLPAELLAASLARWRRAGVVLSALVVALGAYGLHRTLWPVTGDRYVSVLQREPSPALAIRLDPQDGVVRVQVLAPDLPAGGRYALWLVTEKSGTQLISRFSGSTVAHSAALKRVGKAGLANATLTVTVEPAEAAVVPLAPGANVVYRGRLAPE